MNPTHAERLSIPSNPFRTTISIRNNPKSNPNTRFIRDRNPNESDTNSGIKWIQSERNLRLHLRLGGIQPD